MAVLKLSDLHRKAVLVIYLILFPLGLFAYGTGNSLFRQVVVGLSGLMFVMSLLFSESKKEMIIVLLGVLAGGLSEMANVSAGNWSYAPGGGFVNRAQVMFVSYVWGVFIWTIFNLARISENRKNLQWEVGSIIALLGLFSTTRPEFYLDLSTAITFIVGLIPWYLFYTLSSKFEKAVLLYAAFIGLYNEVFGILSGVWYWESTTGTNILTLISAAFGYALPVWLLMKIGFAAAKTELKA